MFGGKKFLWVRIAGSARCRRTRRCTCMREKKFVVRIRGGPQERGKKNYRRFSFARRMEETPYEGEEEKEERTRAGKKTEKRVADDTRDVARAPLEVVTGMDAALPPDQYCVGGAEAARGRARDVRGSREGGRRSTAGRMERIRGDGEGRSRTGGVSRGSEGDSLGEEGFRECANGGGCLVGAVVEEPTLSWRRAPPPAKRYLQLLPRGVQRALRDFSAEIRPRESRVLRDSHAPGS